MLAQLRAATRRTATLLAAAIALMAVVAGVGDARATAARPRAVPVSHVAPFSHVFVVVMENLGYASATGYPGYRSLASHWVAATDSYAASHPSLPNYLDLAAGSTFGIGSDCTSCYVTSPNIASQLSAAHVSWGDYSEGVPHACYLGSSYGGYAGKHNPFRYFVDIRRSRPMCNHLQPLTTLTTALATHPAQVPRFVFVTPNLCHDGHDCSPSTAFAWLSSFIKTVTASSAWSNGGLLVATWDEGSSGDTTTVLPSGRLVGGGGGHVPTLLVAPGVPAGQLLRAPLTHDSLLATIEANFGVPYLKGAAAWAGHTITLP